MNVKEATIVPQTKESQPDTFDPRLQHRDTRAKYADERTSAAHKKRVPEIQVPFPSLVNEDLEKTLNNVFSKE